jgi:hypothetical protein
MNEIMENLPMRPIRIPTRIWTAIRRFFAVAGVLLGLSAAAFSADRPLTVIFASDPQLWWSGGDLYNGDRNIGRKHNEDQIDAMHRIGKELNHWPSTTALDSQSWNARLKTPNFVVMNGDLTAYCHGDEYDAYRELYDSKDPNQPARLKLDMMPGLGNHDYTNNVSFSALPTDREEPQRCKEYIQYAIVIQKGHPYGSRKLNTSILQGYDPGSLAYSYEIDGFHFVQLHLRPTYQNPWINIRPSLDWLRGDLERATQRGKKIIVNQHDFWTGESSEYNSILCGNRVVAIFAGHEHKQAGKVGDLDCSKINGSQGIPYFRSGSSDYQHFLLAEFTTGALMNVGLVSSVGGRARFEISSSSTLASYPYRDLTPSTTFHGFQWAPQSMLPTSEASSEFRPAMVQHGKLLYAFWNGKDDLLYYAHFNGIKWSPQIPVVASKRTSKEIGEIKSRVPPAVAVHDGKIYLAWVGLDQSVRSASGPGNSKWSVHSPKRSQPEKFRTANMPALASFGGGLHLLWNREGHLHHSLMGPLGFSAFSGLPATFLADKASGVSAASDADSLYAVWRSPASNGIKLSTFGGTQWSDPVELDELITRATPAIAIYRGKPFLASDNGGNNGIYYKRDGRSGRADLPFLEVSGANAILQPLTQIFKLQVTAGTLDSLGLIAVRSENFFKDGPSLAVYGDRLYCGWSQEGWTEKRGLWISNYVEW